MRINLVYILLIIDLLLLTTEVSAQSLKTDTVQVGESRLSINLPLRRKKNITNYEEGIFIDYIFKNGAIITLFSGSNQKLPLLDKEKGYFPTIKKEVKHGISTMGMLNGKYWREDSCDCIRILYDNVGSEERRIFDYILDSIHIIKE